MQTLSVGGLALYFEAEDRESADLVRETCAQSVRLIQEHWGLAVPADCRVYVMTSWLRFVFHAAPWPWRVMLVPSLPLWGLRARALWKVAGGWAVPLGRRQAVGVKPLRLLQAADRSLGARVFIPEDHLDEKVRHVTGHELTHAFTAHLRLPVWLNEGLAMVTVDRLVGRPTVQAATLETLAHASPQTGRRAAHRGSQRLSVRDPDALIAQYVRGYWITRYLDEAQPGLLKGLLVRRYSQRALESQVAAALGMERDEFWSRIDDVVVAHFKPGESRGAVGA